MTMRELAQLANVSVSTVSKAFSDAEDVCPETREHIFRIAKQYGCFGKYYKGKFSKKVFAIICSELISDYYVAFVARLQNLIEENGHIAVISTDRFDAKKQAELIEYYASYLHVDGIAVFGLKAPLKKGYDIPVVSIGEAADPNVDSVLVRIEPAMQQAIDLLFARGHRRIAFIGEEKTTSKQHYFTDACQKYPELTFTCHVSAERFEKAGKDGVRAIFSSSFAPTALVCAYDYIAFGAMKELKKRGLSVPQDVSVIGADNIGFTENTEVPLTSIDSMWDEVCAAVWDLLCKKQENKFYRANRDIIIKSTLVLRSSVGEV